MPVAFIKLSRRNSSIVRINPNAKPPAEVVVEASPAPSEAPAAIEQPPAPEAATPQEEAAPAAAEPAPVPEPVAAEPEPVPAAEEPAPAAEPDFSQVTASSLKADIVAYADYLGVPAVGTKAEIWAAIEAHLANQSA